MGKIHWFYIAIPVLVILYVFLNPNKGRRTVVERNTDSVTGFRDPSESEDEAVGNQILPKYKKRFVISNVVFLFLDAFFFMVFHENYAPDKSAGSLSLGLLFLGIVGAHFSFASVPFKVINSVKKREYTVCPCTITDKTSNTVRESPNSAKNYRLYVKDAGGHEEHIIVSLDTYLSASVGETCLMVRFNHEDDLKNGFRARELVLYSTSSPTIP